MRRIIVLIHVLALFLAIPRGLPSAEKRLIAIDDLYRFDGPADAVVADDGQSAIYARRWADPKLRQMRHSLWRAVASPTGPERRPLEPGEPDARTPIYSPDGKWIVFTSTRSFPDGTPAVEPVPAYSDPATDIWFMPAAGGPAIPLAGKGKPYGRVFTDPFYGHIRFSPDGRRLVFVADDGADPRTPAEIANRVRIVREDQGEGYEGYGPAHIWIADLEPNPTNSAAAAIHRLTTGDVWYGDPQWWPDGQSIVVHANRTADRESVRYSINKNYDLWRIDLSRSDRPSSESPPIVQLTNGPGPEICPRISADGRRILCLSIPRKGTHFDIFNLLTIDVQTGGYRTQVLYDHHGSNAVREPDLPPHLPPTFPLPRDCWLSPDTVYYNAAERTETRTQVVRLTGEYRAEKENSPAAHSTHQAKVADARRALLPPANRFLDDCILASNEIVQWKSFDGLEIEGIFTPPSRPDVSQPYPLVVFPHGGPHSRASNAFNLTVQVLAAHGYAVFQPNFRGSGGYGQKFLDADRFDLGGGDMRDILTGIDYLIEQGRIDRERQFLYGVSYGGFSTCSLIGQTHQFRAAIPQNAVTDLFAMWGLSDLQSWTEWEFGGRPWEVPQVMRAHSPLTFASNVRTPTLILHSENDRRCPLPMGRMFYRALRSAGVETQMVIYPDEGHPIQQLPHQEDVLRRILDWFAKHDRKRS